MSQSPRQSTHEGGLPITAGGYEQLCSQLETLQTARRRELRERLRDARDEGDLDDNPALVDLLEEQVLLEQQIATLEAHVAAAHVVPPATDGIAGIGSCVRMRDNAGGEPAEYELVGPLEADVANGRISVRSPVGRALFGCGAGQVVEVETPRGTLKFDILGVSPAIASHSQARRAA